MCHLQAPIRQNGTGCHLCCTSKNFPPLELLCTRDCWAYHLSIEMLRNYREELVKPYQTSSRSRLNTCGGSHWTISASHPRHQVSRFLNAVHWQRVLIIVTQGREHVRSFTYFQLVTRQLSLICLSYACIAESQALEGHA